MLKKMNKWRIIILFIGIIAILAISMVGSVNAANYSLSTSNSTASINNFFSDKDYYDPNLGDNVYSPLANGDTVTFNAGTYNMYLNVNKAVTLKVNGKVNIKWVTIEKNNVKISGFTINGNLDVNGNRNTISGNTINGNLNVNGDINTVSGNTIKNGAIGGNNNKLINNKISGYIAVDGKNNVVDKDLEIKVSKKSSKGLFVTVKNLGSKNTDVCYLGLYKRGALNKKTGSYKVILVGKIKIPALNSKQSKKILVSKKLLNKMKSKTEFGIGFGNAAAPNGPPYIKVDYKNKNKDRHLSNNFVILGDLLKGKYPKLKISGYYTGYDYAA